MKTHWKKNFNIDYLGAYSLEDGKDKTVTIKLLKKEAVTGAKGKKEECLVMYFSDAEKPMILNRTNCKTITKLYGTPFIEDWAGKKITLYVANVDAFGEATDALRIRDTVPLSPMRAEDLQAPKTKLNECATLDALQKAYLTLPKHIQANPEIITLKDELKTKLAVK